MDAQYQFMNKRYKPRLNLSVNLLAGNLWPLSYTTLSSLPQENQFMGFLCFPVWVRGSLAALQAAGAPLLT